MHISGFLLIRNSENLNKNVAGKQKRVIKADFNEQEFDDLTL